jgi:hypothetical protein
VWVLIAASALAQIVGIAWCVIGTVAVLASRRIAAR